MHKSDSVWKWGGKESQDDKIKKSQTNPDTQWYYLLRGKSSINSLAFIFLGYCSIQWIQPAQEKKLASKQAPSSIHSQKMLWKNEAEAKGSDAVLQNTIFTLHLSTGATAIWYTQCCDSVIPSLLGGNNMERTTTYFFFFKWAAVTKQHISHLKQQRWYTNLITYPVIWLRRKGFDTLTIRRSALYAGRRSSGYSIRMQDKSLDWDT